MRAVFSVGVHFMMILCVGFSDVLVSLSDRFFLLYNGCSSYCRLSNWVVLFTYQWIIPPQNCGTLQILGLYWFDYFKFGWSQTWPDLGTRAGSRFGENLILDHRIICPIKVMVSTMLSPAIERHYSSVVPLLRHLFASFWWNLWNGNEFSIFFIWVTLIKFVNTPLDRSAVLVLYVTECIAAVLAFTGIHSDYSYCTISRRLQCHTQSPMIKGWNRDFGSDPESWLP